MVDTKRKVIQLHRVTELEQHCTPETNNTTGSVLKDLVLMWAPNYVQHVDWWRVARAALVVVFVYALAKAAAPYFN